MKTLIDKGVIITNLNQQKFETKPSAIHLTGKLNFSFSHSSIGMFQSTIRCFFVDVFLFHLDFDVFKIATVAQEDKQYHSAVAFSEILFNMKKNPKHLKNPSYLQFFKISHETAKKMYNKALLIHDTKLSKWGPIYS